MGHRDPKKNPRPVAMKLLDESSEFVRVPIRELSPELLSVPSCYEVHGFDNFIAVCPACGAERKDGFVLHRKPIEFAI